MFFVPFQISLTRRIIITFPNLVILLLPFTFAWTGFFLYRAGSGRPRALSGVEVKDMCILFARKEKILGEIDRARGIYVRSTAALRLAPRGRMMYTDTIE